MTLLPPLLLLAALGIACGGDAAEDDMKRMSPELADQHLGLSEGRLKPCVDMPNCVCSQHPGAADHFIDPLPAPDPDAAWARLEAVLADRDRVEILTNDRPYLHARFTTAVFRFEDDVEFLLDEEAGVLHVRSASRLGYSDLGKNRKRVESLRKQLIGG